MSMELTMWLPWIVSAVGLLIVVGGAASLLWFESGRRRVRWCCRCAHSWSGRDRYCPRCGGKGRTSPPPEHKIPAVDWQGHMDTGPIPRITDDMPSPYLSSFAPVNWTDEKEAS